MARSITTINNTEAAEIFDGLSPTMRNAFLQAAANFFVDSGNGLSFLEFMDSNFKKGQPVKAERKAAPVQVKATPAPDKEAAPKKVPVLVPVKARPITANVEEVPTKEETPKSTNQEVPEEFVHTGNTSSIMGDF